MTKLFHNLTNTGVSSDGTTKFYSDPSQAGQAFATAEAKMAPTVSQVVPDQVSPDQSQAPGIDVGENSIAPNPAIGPQSLASFVGGANVADPTTAQFSSETSGPAPTMTKPSFASQAFDSAGNVQPKAGLTKGGLVASLLLNGIQSIGDGLPAALNANWREGEGSFGPAMKAAQQAPIQRRQQAQEFQRRDLESQLLQDQVKYAPLLRRLDIEAKTVGIGKDRAQEAKDAADAIRAKYFTGEHGQVSVLGPDGLLTEVRKGSKPPLEAAVDERIAAGDTVAGALAKQEQANKEHKPQTYDEIALAFQTEKDPVLKAAYGRTMQDAKNLKLAVASRSKPETESDYDRNIRRGVDGYQAHALSENGMDIDKTIAAVAAKIQSGNLNPESSLVASRTLINLKHEKDTQGLMGLLEGMLGGGQKPHMPVAAPIKP